MRPLPRAKHDAEDLARELYRAVWNTLGAAHLANSPAELAKVVDAALAAVKNAELELEKLRAELP